jgi:formyltetrahydrofolate synthetase
VRAAALEAGASAAVTTNHHALGGAGAMDLGEAVIKACSEQSEFKFLYDVGMSIKVGWSPRVFVTQHIKVGGSPRVFVTQQ